MKRLAVCMLFAMLATGIGACGKGDVSKTDQMIEDLQETGIASEEPGDTEEAGNIPADTPAGEPGEESPEDDGIWQQCLDMEENARLGEYPDISINGTTLSMDWTVKDFLEKGLLDNAVSIEVRTVTEQDGEHVYNTVNPTAEELKEGMAGTDVFVITDSFTASFSMPGTSFENEMALIAQEMPLSTFTAKDNFECRGIKPDASRTDVATVFGPTHWGGEGLMYICGASMQGYTEFTFNDGALDEIYINIEN